MLDKPCIKVTNLAGEDLGVVTVEGLADDIIQDSDVALRIVRDLAADGAYDFVGDGIDESTDQIFTVIDPDALAAQLAVFEAQCEA